MSDFVPHVTVATVVDRGGRFLLVEELDRDTGQLVFNQPAGHLEAGETLQAAALRETLEETGWVVELTGVIGTALYTSPVNGVTYYRTAFAARALEAVPGAVLDAEIQRIHWLDYESVLANSARMRSPLVIRTIENYRQGHHYPLDLIYSA